MVIKEILEKSDALFAEGKHQEAAAFLEGKAVLAQNQDEWKVELSIINELMGYYRGISQLSKAWDYAFRAIQITEENAVGDSAEGITTYLNVANVYRAAGKPKEALSLYQQVAPYIIICQWHIWSSEKVKMPCGIVKKRSTC